MRYLCRIPLEVPSSSYIYIYFFFSSRTFVCPRRSIDDMCIFIIIIVSWHISHLVTTFVGKIGWGSGVISSSCVFLMKNRVSPIFPDRTYGMLFIDTKPSVLCEYFFLSLSLNPTNESRARSL